MKNSYLNLSFILFLLALPSCVTIFSRANQPVRISTQQAGGTIYMSGNPVNTPKVKLAKRLGSAEFTVKKEGYLDRNYTVVTSKNNPLRYTNVLWIPTFFGILIAVYDFIGPKVYQFKPQYSIPPNEPAPPSRAENEKYIFVNETSVDIPKDAVIERGYNSERLYNATEPSMIYKNTGNKNLHLNASGLTHDLKDFLHAYKYRDSTKKLFPSYTNTLYINAKVRDLIFDVVYPNSYMSFPLGANPKINANLTVEYEILDYYEQSLMKKEFKVSSDFFGRNPDIGNKKAENDSIGNGYARSLQNAMEITMSKLLVEKEFRNLLPLSEDTKQDETLEISRPSKKITRLNDLIKAAVTIKNGDSHGSGFVISETGYIITNFHVAANAEKDKFKAILNDGTEIPATLVRFSRKADLALLKVEKTDLACMSVQDVAAEAEIGAAISTIGTPKSIELGQSVTKGIISGFRKANDISYLQTDMSINSGNSGGAIITEDGVVIGVVTSKLAGIGIEGIGFGTPSALIFSELKLKYK